MNKKITLLATFGITLCLVAMFFSCSEWQKGKRGTRLDDDLFILDADTFCLQYHNTDYSVLFVCPNDSVDATIMVMKRDADSLYYLKAKKVYISPVYDTEDFILVNHSFIYDLVNNKKHKLPFEFDDDIRNRIFYLGDWNNEHLFSKYSDGYNYPSSEVIYFPDGTLVPLSDGARALHIEQDGKIKIERRGLSITMDIDELHNYKSLEETRQDVIDDDIEIVNETYEEKPIPGDVNFRVYVEVPKGNTKADKTIKKYIFQAICENVFWPLDYDSKRLYSLSSIESGDIRSALSQAAEVWRKEVRKKFSTCDKDSDLIHFSYYAAVFKVAQGDNYVTYCYDSEAFLGGNSNHCYYYGGNSNPFYYYLTYDKQRDVFVNSNNTIKKGMVRTFKEIVQKWVIEQNVIWHYNGVEAGSYPCAAGLCGHYSITEEELHFPLPHFSIVPDGVTFSFSGGEYHILIPKEDIQDFLEYDYWTNDTIALPFSYFIGGARG